MEGQELQPEYMSLDPRFAQSLVDIVSTELAKNVNITDKHGKIIASFSKDRIGQMHEASANMLAKGKPIEFSVSADDERRMRGVRRGFNVPIMLGNQCVGVIGVTGDPDTAAPYARLAARFVGAALEANAHQEKLVRALKENHELQSVLLNRTISVQEQERKKISRELHDETSQALTSIIVGLRVLSDSVLRQEDKQKILDMRDLVVTTLEAVHHLAVELRPVLLDDLGLVAAAQKYTDSYAKQYQIQLDMKFVNVSRERFLPEIEITLYRILQEALTNIAKHAKANKIQIILKKVSSKLILNVHDNGTGFNTAILNKTSDYTSLGIYGMKERIALLHGTFEIESSPGNGTTICVELPIKRKRKTGNA